MHEIPPCALRWSLNRYGKRSAGEDGSTVRRDIEADINGGRPSIALEKLLRAILIEGPERPIGAATEGGGST